jgi:hypothetical protein
VGLRPGLRGLPGAALDPSDACAGHHRRRPEPFWRLGIRAAAILAEGPDRTEQARDIASEWFRDVIQTLKPKLVNRMTAAFFGHSPIENVDDVVQRLRSRYYKTLAFAP